MSIREVTMYQVACDAPDCKVTSGSPGLGEHYAWDDEETADGEWSEAGGLNIAGKHYCLDHTRWCRECGTYEIPSFDGGPGMCAACLRRTGSGESLA